MSNYYHDRLSGPTLVGSLLDSSLISTSKWGFYSIKIIECGNYYHVYKYEHFHKKKNRESVYSKNIDINLLFDKKENISSEPTYKQIEERNILRSKFSLQRLVKTNEDKFKTFITLTFEENLTDINIANKKFNQFVSNLKKRLKNDFCYVCVPEFQSRGAVHYHLLTNINYTDFSLLSKEELKIYKPKKGWQVFRSLKPWRYGFSNVVNLKDINVVSYISKYMTKDIDNRLFGKRRYLYSRNLKKPTDLTLNLSDIEDFKNFVNFIPLDKCDLLYRNSYFDIFGESVEFYEFKKGE